MGTSVYFNNQNATREQFLIEDLIIESIKNHGIDVFYLPRESRSSIDELFGDDPVKSFSKAYPIEMYLETFQDFEGNQEFFAKFGLEIQKSARIAVARRTFERYVPTALRNTPKEGDLIWMPVQQKLLEIKRVEEEKNFFQAGKIAPYMFGLSIETFKYNGEFFDTGILEIDVIQDTASFAVEYTMDAGGTSTYEDSEQVYQGSTGATNYTVTNSGASAYVINGSNDPTLTFLRGLTYTFNINATGHPFWIQTVSGAYSSGNVYSSGVVNNGTQVGTITFTVPIDAPDTLYYVCQNHATMAGSITINSPTATGYVANWDKPTLKLKLRNIKGAFAANAAIVGTVSGASWTMASGDVQEDANDAFEDNVRIETEADNILDWTETNPFGSANE